jgi:hypothetical protein
LKSSTWARDSHGLFDYECSKLSKTSLKTASVCYLARKGQEVLQRFQEASEPDLKYLLHLTQQEGALYLGHFALCPSQLGEKSPKNRLNEKLYLVVKHLKNSKGYQVAEGDVLKMGRLKFRIKELKGADPAKRVEKFSLQDLVNFKCPTDESDDESEEKGTKFKLPCRICLSEMYVEENPLICPCNCDGTMKYIHLRCLQRALRSKVTTRSTESALSFSWKSMSCDLCKRPYPYRFELNGRLVELVQIPKPPEKYVILEGLCKDKNSSKWLHVVSLNSKDSIKFGRATDCELRMTDISVSRLHGVIRLVGEKFFLEDKNSKFGTLVQIKRPLALECGTATVVQCGRTVVEATAKRPWSLIPACFRSTSASYELFATQNTGVLPLMPVNTGIPLSVDDLEELKYRAGVYDKRQRERHHENLMFEYGQLGLNSSYEDDETDGVEAVQEVIVADVNEAQDEERREEEKKEEDNGKEFVYKEQRSHSFV